MPDPYDNIGRLRRHEQLYYFDVARGDVVVINPWQGWTTRPAAVFRLEGLERL